jgi:hemerythrin-like domain-containing protein
VDLSLLDQLEREHREAESLIARLEDAKGEAEQRELTEKLAMALAKHMEVEERDVYPALRKIDPELVDEANNEHDLARTGVAEMATLIGEPGFAAAVAMVKAGLEHHVEDEESEVFPKLRKAAKGLRDDMTKDELYDLATEVEVAGRGSMSKDELHDALSV